MGSKTVNAKMVLSWHKIVHRNQDALGQICGGYKQIWNDEQGEWLCDSCIGTQQWNALKCFILIVRKSALDMVEDKQPES